VSKERLKEKELGSVSVSNRSKNRFPAKAQRRKEERDGVEGYSLLAFFFAPLRLCGRFLLERQASEV
jgi:hypothetical protein